MTANGVQKGVQTNRKELMRTRQVRRPRPGGCLRPGPSRLDQSGQGMRPGTILPDKGREGMGLEKKPSGSTLWCRSGVASRKASPGRLGTPTRGLDRSTNRMENDHEHNVACLLYTSDAADD